MGIAGMRLLLRLSAWLAVAICKARIRNQQKGVGVIGLRHLWARFLAVI
jgi:hypothetical protein